MGEIFITSDWHFFHDKDFILTPRGFKTMEEMNNEIIARHNSIVSPNDKVFVLGDCALGGPVSQKHIDILKQMNGQKSLVIGNHDTDAKIKDYLEANIFEEIQLAYRIKYKKIMFYLTHHPLLVANENDKPTWNLHGHTHSSEKFSEYSNCYNVNMEAHNCYPIHMDSVYEDIKQYRKGENV